MDFKYFFKGIIPAPLVLSILMAVCLHGADGEKSLETEGQVLN